MKPVEDMGADMGANLEPAGDIEQVGGLDILPNDNSLDDINFEDIDIGNLDTTLTGGANCSSHRKNDDEQQGGGDNEIVGYSDDMSYAPF